MFGFGSKREYNVTSQQSDSDNKFYTGLFIGVIIGAGLYWLFKSESGKKVRDALLNSEEEWAKKAKEFISETEFAELLGDSEEEKESASSGSKRNFVSSVSQ